MTESQDKSTPRPWAMNWAEDAIWIEQEHDSSDVATMAPRHLDGNVLADEMKANAALIVQAVNSHDAMKECVEALKDVAVPTGKLDTYEGALEVIDRLQRRALKALAALAKLEKANG